VSLFGRIHIADRIKGFLEEELLKLQNGVIFCFLFFPGWKLHFDGTP